MRIRIERLRRWLLAGAALVVVIVAGFIGSARYLRRHWLATLPAKLGANVKVDTSGITWSHTYQGQTDFVVHAAKEVEHTDGKIALHDVWIKLCGRQQKRADMVRGDEWEWDKKADVIRALGVVHIELREAVEGKAGCSATDDVAAGNGDTLTGTASSTNVRSKTLRVTTSNLIYMEKLELAATSAPIEFESGALEGHAVGADYASDTGTLMLHSAVRMTGTSAGRAVTLDAASAELDGQERVARLTGAKYTSGAGDAARTAAADNAVLYLRADQTLERIEAQGNVTMQAGGGTVMATKADVAMNAAGHPVNALLTGGVRYAAQEALMERRGEAEQAAIALDGKASPQAQHAVFTGAAHFVERSRADAKATGNTRELSAAKLEVALAPGADGKNQVRDAEATGGARFSEVSAKAAKSGVVVTTGTGASTTEISGDDLEAHFGAGDTHGGRRSQVESIRGQGHTLVRKVDAAGVEQTSAGDKLEARFKPGVASESKKRAAGASDDFTSANALASAVQSGNVVVMRKDPAKSEPGDGGDVEEARAPQVVYDGDSDRMTLNGGVQMTDSGSLLQADRVVMEHATGNAQASGGVKVEYAEGTGSDGKQSRQKSAGLDASRGANPGADPAHVMADSAELNHAIGIVTFHGAPVRMWQGGSQVLAPVIEIDKKTRRLEARGESATAAQVRTVLMRAGGSDASAGQAGGAAGSAQACADTQSIHDAKSLAQPQVVRVTSGGLEFSQVSNEADFTGGFRAETADATIRANAGSVYLKGTKGEANAAQAGIPALEGNVDHVVASGQVVVDRPGLRATGERLVYTAASEDFLLTGDAKAPPKALDARGNMTTGAALKFHRACGRMDGDTVVEVLNSIPGTTGVLAGVHSEVRADVKRKQPVR